jgi:hypothetical protein
MKESRVQSWNLLDCLWEIRMIARSRVHQFFDKLDKQTRQPQPDRRWLRLREYFFWSTLGTALAQSAFKRKHAAEKNFVPRGDPSEFSALLPTARLKAHNLGC